MKVALILIVILLLGIGMGYIINIDNNPKCFFFGNNTEITEYYIDNNLSSITNSSKQIIICNFEPINYEDAKQKSSEVKK